MNYEKEVEELIIKSLELKFGIKEKNLFNYIQIRYLVIYHLDSIHNKNAFLDFILKELNIVSYQYKDILFTYLGEENSWFNVMNDFYSLYGTNLEYYTKDIISQCKKYAKRKVKKYPRDEYFDKYILYFELEFLNQKFNIKLNDEFISIENFEQEESFNLEYELERYIKAVQIASNTTQFISEKEFETYMISHLDLIEDGLIYLDRQFVLEEGFIDILAKDKENNIVIIELKIEEDKRIIWQSIYYPQQIAKKYPNQKIRMITISPSYPNYLLDPLNTLNVEKFVYDIKVSNKKIIDVTLNKI